MTTDLTVFTPYSTIQPLITENPEWVPETEQERIASYDIYDKLYWSYRKALKIAIGEDQGSPIYVPTPRTIVDSTSHFLLKGLQLVPKKAAGASSSDDAGGIDQALSNFLKRERFYSRFHTNKSAGVRRGDFVFHLTVDPTKPAGSRLSLTQLDPSNYFPIWDEDDINKLVGVDIVEQWLDDSGKPRVHRLRYQYEYYTGGRRVTVEDGIFEVEGWWKGKSAKVVQIIESSYYLPDEIDTIPVFHFPNIEDVDNPFGSSELRGFERIIQGVNQAITDEELALALQGLGVYATDAPPPVDEEGEEVDWVIAPAAVMSMSGGTFFKRVEGLGSVQPSQDHLKFLVDNLYEGAGVFRGGQIDVAVAESGVALAIKFMPTLAKIEQRDQTGQELLDQMFYNWIRWHKAFEGQDFTGTEILVEIGDKLPESRKEKLNELNNMHDRKVISGAYYRSEMEKLGYKFPDQMQEEIIAEQRKWMELQQMYKDEKAAAQEGQDGNESDTVPGNDNKSNNKSKPNESGGTEAT